MREGNAVKVMLVLVRVLYLVVEESLYMTVLPITVTVWLARYNPPYHYCPGR